MLRFCAVCNNLLYEKLEADTMALVYECKCCGNVLQADVSADHVSVMESNYVDDDTKYLQFITPHLIHDPTLPRVDYIPCINGDACTRRATEQEREVIVVKYDAVHVKFMYQCVHCGTSWLLGKGKM